MIVYKYFIKIALKQKSIILGYTSIFLLLAIINGTSTDTKKIKFTETRLTIGVIDNMNSELSRGLTDYLAQKNNMVDIREDDEYIRDQIFLGAIDGVIIIPGGFDEKVVRKEKIVGIYKDDREIGASYLEQQVEKYLVFANSTYKDGKFHLEDLKEALNQKVNVEIVGDQGKIKNIGANNWFKNYYNFTSYIIIAMYLTVISLVMTEFKDEKIENRIKISSKRFIKFNKEIYLGQISVGVVITSIFILGSLLLKGKYIGEVNFSKYVINIIVFSFTILCLTFLINNLTRNRFVITGISTVVSLGTSFISGIFVPQEFLSEKALTIAKFFPTYYFVRINEGNMNSLMDMRYDILIQVMFGVVFLLVGLYFAKVKQEV
ncbi:MAG TPA: ABC transporter permease [Epulopiscium sp.]|nr:ABC transporter permease [Candidatus Epulonipiscium sp.]